jgi:chromosome segregation ATPase
MLAGLVSSPATLAKFFQKSRDAWKQRSHQYQERIKALDGKVRDLERSRDKWKAKAKAAQQELDALRCQFGNASATTHGWKTWKTGQHDLFDERGQ